MSLAKRATGQPTAIGMIHEITTPTALRARLVVCGLSQDKEDAELLLAALDLRDGLGRTGGLSPTAHRPGH